MIDTLAIAQLAVPLLLILWLGVAPMPGRWRWLQALAVGLVVLGVALAGLWFWPSVHAPYALGAAWLLAAVFGRRRAARRGDRAGVLVPLFALLLAAGGGGVAALAIKGRMPPPGPVTDLGPPTGPGTLFVANGGAERLINPHLGTLDESRPRFRSWRGQSFGVDLVAVDGYGRRLGQGPTTAPESYLIFDRPVIAPCAGAVIHVTDGLPDLPVPETDTANPAGNHVILDCGGTWVVLAHLRQGSIVVATGDTVGPGTPLGRVGNSGNTSEPHLHIHAQTPGTPEHMLSGDPVPITIAGRYPVRGRILRLP